MRSTREVIEDHLALRREHDLGADVERNYADDLLVMAKDGVFRGKDGIRKTARILQENLPDATYRYELLRVADDYALLGWSATAANGARTRHGADAFVVKDGLIAVQIIHYDVAPPD
ncbi:nuclear transport factor 2 family protein [Pelagerythrobacter aerophilus]|uniref:Nuclear transport factor 2 family protein n=1 Tax=Pelagerythrobacter aerophilus TaxID=2306995 RepID=A0A418NMQ1_9SPHN|nr:nuclear transport factor 2 family protein [Pelagerythrobacter aerophilus]RIV81424.1 nuclear transport factor 2 family protein [Pelagerythrobacter aerophilus]